MFMNLIKHVFVTVIVNLYLNHNFFQISLMSESTENRPVGNWFGPNAVAQTIK